MIYLAEMNRITTTMNPVTTADYVVGKGANFHPEGLFSEQIFGPKDSPDRRKTFSFIELHCKIIHPALVKPIWLLNRKIIDAVNRERSFKFDENSNLVEDKDGDITGVSSVIKNFEKMLSREETAQSRIDMKNMVMNYWKQNLVFIDKCIVIPAAYRDAEVDEVHGGLRTNPINDYYVKIIRQSIQIESISLAEGPMYDIMSAKMQFLINDLYNYIVKKISKKQGLVRQSILGKRADFTGGAVITGGASDIKVDEIGIPFKVLVKLYEPFIIHDIHNSGNIDQKEFARLQQEYNGDTFSIPATRRLLTSAQKGFSITKELEDMIRSSVIRVIRDKVVIAKRDPALHAESVQGFKPKMVEGSTIQLSILKCSAYNADFDGDRMAIYVPVTKEAIEETREKMISSESKDSIKAISDDFSKDIIIGIFAMTRDSGSDRAPVVIKDDKVLDTMSPLTKVKYDGKITTVGRVLFNKVLPSKKYYISDAIGKKGVNALAAHIHKDYFEDRKEVYVKFCDDVVRLGMKYYTIMAPSFTLSDIIDIPASVFKIKEELKNSKTDAETSDIIDKMTEAMKQHLEKKATNIGIIGQAGGLKNGYSQARQILVSKGLITDSTGNVQLIEASYGEGFKSDDFFKSGFGSRKGIIDRVINTSETGYLSRQLVYALQRVEADPRIKDCKTKRFVTIKASPDIASRLEGRYIVDDERKVVPFDIKKHLNQVVHLRSPLYCVTSSICNTCYGDLLIRNKTKYVGILAAEVCGERLTQTIMRTFHVGGAVSIKTVDIINELSRILDSSEKRILIKNFEQEKTYLKALEDGEIEINLSDYLDPHKDIHTTTSNVDLNYAYFRLKYSGVSVDATIDNKIEIDLKDKILTKTDSIISIRYKKGSIVFNCVATSEAFSEQVKIIQSLLSGKTPYKNSDHFLMKIYDQYSTLNTGSDLIHLEILASNLLRDKGNPSFPARRNPNYNAIVMSLKNIPKLESWLQSFAFENPNASITSGLIYDRPTDETILEKIITGKF